MKLVCAVLAVALHVAAQTSNRIAGSVAELQTLSRQPWNPNLPAELDAAAARIHADVDRFIEARRNRRTLRTALPRLLAQLLDQPPVFFSRDAAAGYDLAVAYALHKGSRMGPGATSVTLRAYCLSCKRPALLDAAGADLAGYASLTALKLHTLPLPVADQKFADFLLAGHMTGANGPSIRMRAYCFKDSRFQTIWMPADTWGSFRLRLTPTGFVLSWEYYRSNRKHSETYEALADSLMLRLPQI